MADVDGQIVLGLNISDTTAKIRSDLDSILQGIGKKEIVLSARIENIKNDRITSQINDIQKRLSQSLTMRDVKFNVSIEQSNIDKIKQQLKGFEIKDDGAKALTKELTSMDAQLEKVRHKWVEVQKAEENGTTTTQKLLEVMVQGTTEGGKLVTVTKQFNTESGEVVRAQTQITDNLKTQQVEQEKLAKQAQADNNARIKYLSQQKTLLEDIQAAYTGKTSAKLAQEEAKIADQMANMANSYRGQAKDNSFENSISALEAKFHSLKNVSTETTTTMTNEFAKLRQYVETIATSTDNAQVVNAYEQFDAAIKRVSNNLQILQREEKNSAAAAKAEAEAVRQAAKEQETLARSATLSNKIEAWMNSNEKAAQKYGDRLRDLQSILANNKDPAMLSQAGVEFAKIQSEAKAAGLTTNQFATSLKNTALQLMGLSSGIMVLRKVISVIKEGVNAVIELDTALIDLKKTTTMSGSDLAAFYKDANKAAIELGVTTKDIIQSAADWSRLGFSDKKSAESMAKLAAQFAAISPGVSIEESTTGLVSVIKAYGIEVEDVLDGVMSKINIVGNTAATSNQQIITGLQNSASAMSAMGSTLEENIALFTAAQEITQDESKVGNALRSISMRIRGYDEETEQLSEELSNITGEVVDLTKTASNMQGVSLFTDATQTEYKSIYQYLKEISEIYDELGQKQQQELMEKLFGKNRASVGQAILQNFEAAEKAMNSMANSAGNADAEMEVITQSLEYKLNALKETSVGIFQNMFSQKDIGNIVDVLTGLLKIIGSITTALGPLGTAFASVGIVAFVKNLD